MFNEPVTDPTAGERAREIRQHPAVPQPILDPTDPRYGSTSSKDEYEDLEEETPRHPIAPKPASRL